MCSKNLWKNLARKNPQKTQATLLKPAFSSTHKTTMAAFNSRITLEQIQGAHTVSLVALNAKLPKGSFVVLVGLVDGRVLFNNMHARQHPVGKMVVIFEID